MAHGLRVYKHLQSWAEYVMGAPEALHIKKLVAINGQSRLGKDLYQKAKCLRAKRASSWACDGLRASLFNLLSPLSELHMMSSVVQYLTSIFFNLVIFISQLRVIFCIRK